MNPIKRLTLIELVVVLIILVALGGVAVSFLDLQHLKIGPSEKDVFTVVTEASLQTLGKALFGEPNRPGYYQDMGQIPERFPKTLVALFQVPSDLPLELQSFQPQTALGWRGPYLLQTSGSYGKFDGSVYSFRGNGFDATYGNPEDPAILDAWGNPIILQIDFDGVAGITSFEVQYCRLVSAGPNNILETLTTAGNIVPGNDMSTELTLSECGDDLVLFLQVADLRQ